MDIFSDSNIIIIVLKYLETPGSHIKIRQLSNQTRKKIIKLQNEHDIFNFEVGFKLDLLYNMRPTKVNFPFCPADYRYIAPIWNRKMKSITITSSMITDISGLVDCENLNLSGCCEITNFEALRGRVFKTLNLSKTQIEDMSKITIEKELDISHCAFITNFTFLNNMDLYKLNVQYTNFRRIIGYITGEEIKPYIKLGNIKHLYVESYDSRFFNNKLLPVRHYETLSFSPMPNQTNDESFINFINTPPNTAFIMRVTDIIQLEYKNNKQITTDNLIIHNLQLREARNYLKSIIQKSFNTFDLSGSQIDDLSALKDINISRLILKDCGNLMDMKFLEGKTFKYLNLSGTILRDLSKFKVTETFIIESCTGIKKFEPLYKIPFKLLNLTETRIRMNDMEHIIGDKIIITNCRLLHFNDLSVKKEEFGLFSDKDDIIYL